ncbi:neurotensin/neuromedin N [Epinephelus fuscoguttatus]|uniref:neurotensin/neuromedin N n=1 Tax=Epinephelus fuscoguttatus TaxID=293821 RepID=UPI0020D0EF77|nr:neurotensin/neuromedin N [Epinephelus fuscoguttatus]XP_049429037.1 neurotensin/neuromedin N [Epinephelus fuscoguttatus]XP_049429038.1 neurotensin/neuromedin N [Epinephelus fuscoguttatus]
MQAQVAWLLLLCFTCGGLCTDVDLDQRALEEELLSSLFTSKMKQNKQSAPYWRVSLANLCRMVSSLRQEAWSGEEEEEGSELTEGGLQLLEELYNLQLICRALQSREERLLHDSQEYLEENGGTPLKRKSPYILKRQASHTTKSRRPYILKRSTIY